MQARLFVTTGTPVQPHSCEGLEGLDVHFRWVMVPHVIFEHVGLASDANTLVGFCEQFGLEIPEDLLLSHHTAVRLCHTIRFCVCIGSQSVVCVLCIFESQCTSCGHLLMSGC